MESTYSLLLLVNSRCASLRENQPDLRGGPFQTGPIQGKYGLFCKRLLEEELKGSKGLGHLGHISVFSPTSGSRPESGTRHPQHFFGHMLDHMLKTRKTDIKNLLLNVSPMRHSIFKGASISARLRERQFDSFKIKIRNIAKHKMILRSTLFPVSKLGQKKQQPNEL